MKKILILNGGNIFDYIKIEELLFLTNRDVVNLVFCKEIHINDYNAFVAKNKWCKSMSQFSQYYRVFYWADVVKMKLQNKIHLGLVFFPYEIIDNIEKLCGKHKPHLLVCRLKKVRYLHRVRKRNGLL